LELHHQYTAEDVLHDFLVRRVYPPRQARMMFASSARGERPLRPRLLASIANHTADLGRSVRRRRERGGSDDLPLSEESVSAAVPPRYEEVEHHLRRQMVAIRAACPLRRRPRGAAYREALLLRQRLDVAAGLGAALRSELSGADVVLDLSQLERLTG